MSTGTTAGSSLQPRQWWESKWRWEKCRDGRAAARDSRSLAKAGLFSVDFIGESHMGFMTDCLAAAPYAKNVSTTAYASAKQRAKQTTTQTSENLNSPAGALAAAQNTSVDKWASCLGPEKSWGCWPDWDGSKGAYNRFPKVGLSTFRPHLLAMDGKRRQPAACVPHNRSRASQRGYDAPSDASRRQC